MVMLMHLPIACGVKCRVPYSVCLNMCLNMLYFRKNILTGRNMSFIKIQMCHKMIYGFCKFANVPCGLSWGGGLGFIRPPPLPRFSVLKISCCSFINVLR